MSASSASGRFLALCGGVGGAKLALGLTRVLPPERLLVVGNSGDDFEHLGLHVSPDLDTVMYTLAGLANPETGWGLAGETWGFLAALERLGAETWFRLGDHDLATHVERTRRLRAGDTLSAITADLSRALGVATPLAPMSDQPVRTVVETADGDLAFQVYFVRERCAPAVRRLRFEGAAEARPSPAFAAALADPALEAVVICPSNPYLSVDPILAVPGVLDGLRASAAPVVAVSPIVGGRAIKGPTAKIMAELGVPASAVEVARRYRELGILDRWVLDEQDRALAPAVEALGVEVSVAPTVMLSLEDKVRLARRLVERVA
ncbi:MAG TPA: 2-phospho-L-lactate transferase [Thermoanaerobaculia bacterium]|nr:2-phospho-L-lactate transferase [Thermoanaerobaculia bacterium]